MEYLDPIKLLYSQTPIFILIMFRIAGVLVYAPILGSFNIPYQIKIFLVLILAFAVFPMVAPQTMKLGVEIPNTFINLSVGVMKELIIGISMGFALLLMFVGVQVGAEMISQQMGLNLSRVIDPMTGNDTDIMAQFYMLVATLLYVLMNGHIILIKTIVETFERIPLMGVHIGESLVATFVAILTGSFMLGVRVAGPALAAVFLATLAMGFISRTMPQLNILAAGFPVRIVLSLVLIIASFASVFALFEGSIVNVLSNLGMLFA